jgi:hypothetical protein
MSWAQADGVIAGSLYYGFGVFNRLRKGRKYGFTYTDAFGEISHPLRVLLTPYIGACVGGLVWMGIESHNASAEQFAINQQVMQTGRGNITCDFGDGKKVVLEQPGKLEEPMRAIVMNGLNAGTCKAQLSISP